MFPYSPFVPFRVSPSEKSTPAKEFGLGGWLCEQYRLETGCGEWRNWGFINAEGKYEEDGAWVFYLDDRMHFDVPVQVLQHFNLTRDTFEVLQQTASALKVPYYVFHFVPRKDWKDSFKDLALFDEYKAECERLHQPLSDSPTRTNSLIFGETGKKKSRNILDNLKPQTVTWARHYYDLNRRISESDLFSDEESNLVAERDSIRPLVATCLQEDGYTSYQLEDLLKIVTEVVKWYGR